jgi:hypothetical protein
MTVTAATAKVVRDREHGRCQLCLLGEFEAGMGRFALHHVAPKGPGGTSDPTKDLPSNLALLHDRLCHPWVHAHPREARALGLLASRLGKVRPSALIARRPA